MVHPSPGAGKGSPCGDDLCAAVEELRTLLEPTPEQLATSYRRVRQALSSLPPPASPAGQPPVQSSAPSAPRARPGSELQAPRRRRAQWLASSGAAVAVAAAFALGRITAAGDGGPDARQEAPASRAAAAPALSSDDAGAARIEQRPEHDAVAARDIGAAEPALEAPVVASPTAPRAIERSRAAPPPCRSQEDALLRAECQLRRGWARRALDTLRGVSKDIGHDRELVSALELLAQCQLQRDVRALAARFFDEWPASPLRERIRNECPSALSDARGRAAGAAGAPPALRITRAAPEL